MKKILVVLVVAVAGLLAYNYYTTGSLSLLPSSSLGDDELALRDLRERFEAARKEFAQAGRGAALGGIDTTAEAEAARLEVERVQRGLADLKGRLTGDTVKQEAERLERSIREFMQDSK